MLICSTIVQNAHSILNHPIESYKDFDSSLLATSLKYLRAKGYCQNRQ